ncbi:MAG: O-antigen ligase family protein [Firmicutes bacterium]|nr:O-antigen ligase family protein [Bacillota bacterium]
MSHAAQFETTLDSVPGTWERPAKERRWDLAFVGLLFYLVVEYTRLGAMYPVLVPLQIGKIAVALGIIGWILAPRGIARRPLAVLWMDRWLLLFLFTLLFVTLLAVHSDRAWTGFFDILRWLVIYFLITRVLTNGWRLRVFLLLLLLLNLKMAQFVVRSYFTLLAAGVPGWALAKFGVGAGSTGFFANAADFGVGMCIIFPVAGYLFFARESKLIRMLLFASALTFLAAILVCGSRGALVGALASGAAALLRNPRKSAALMMLVIVIVGVVYFLPEASKDRVESGMNWQQDGTASHRIYLWKQGLKMFQDHPIFGVGPHNYPIVRFEHYNENDPHPGPFVSHSVYIEALTELGLIGLVPLIVLFILFFRLNALTRKQILATDPAGKQNFFYCLALGLDLGMIGFMASAAFVSVLYYPHIWLLLGLSASLHTVAVQSSRAAVPEQSPVRETFKEELLVSTTR